MSESAHELFGQEPDELTTTEAQWYYGQQMGLNGGIVEPFVGLSHAEVLQLEFPPERMLVSDLVPIGAVGTIAGVPETFKSWQAQRIAVMVGSGEGEVFGKGVEHSGPVGYFWQDDSTREEAERVKLYDAVRQESSDVDVRWFLNEGLRLPDDMERLCRTINHFHFVLVVLDSFYNVLFGMDLKDEGAERTIAELKTRVCDATGCTVLIVDHMPWATDVNRGRLRSYGGVFKGAATRFGIYIDAVGNKVWVEARGNNIVGFKRTLAEWDADALEMRLIDAPTAVSDEEYAQRILDYLAENTDVPTSDLSGKDKQIKGDNNRLVTARGQLLDEKRLVRRRKHTNHGPYLWNLSSHADLGGMEDDSYQLNTGEWYGGMAGMPLRGSTSAIPPTNTSEFDEGPLG